MAVELETVRRVEGEIWTQALAAERDPAPAARSLHPALNHMFDISTNRTMAMNMHAHGDLRQAVWPCADRVDDRRIRDGAGGSRAWFHVIGFAAVAAMVAYVILDIEHPRLGSSGSTRSIRR